MHGYWPAKGLFFILLILIAQPRAQGPDKKNGALNKAAEYIGFPQATQININNIVYWQFFDGSSGIDPNGDAGTIFPKGTKNIVYKDGVVWGLRVGEEVKVGGQLYKTGTRPRLDHIYRIRADWRSLTRKDILQDAASLFQQPVSELTDERLDQVLEQYRRDWKNWPVDQGAPYVDVDNNGSYNPVLDDEGMPDEQRGDYPGILGADQVAWYLVDDDDADLTQKTFASDPLGVELSVTVWAYRMENGAQANVIYKKYQLRNISGQIFEDMYLAQWVDPDIGNYTDDLVACDSLTNTAFAYNAGDYDINFRAMGFTPAVGYTLLQGPVVPSPGDQAYFKGQLIDGYKNLPMTSFTYEPSGVYDSTLDPEPKWLSYKLYNRLRGYLPTTDIGNPQPYAHRDSNIPTKYPLNGDPVTGSGDVDGRGQNFAPADRNMMISCGPFTLQPGEEQEMVVAMVAGKGDSPVGSFNEVRKTINLLGPWRGRSLRLPTIHTKAVSMDGTRSRLSIQADIFNFDTIDSCRFYFASEGFGGDTLSLPLYDDGVHESGPAGDNVFGNSMILSNRPRPQNGYLKIYSVGKAGKYPNSGKAFAARPAPQMDNIHLIWEDGKQDGKPNPGERVSVGFTIANPDAVNDIGALEVSLQGNILLNSGIRQNGRFTMDKPYYSFDVQSTDTLSLDFTIKYDGLSEEVFWNMPVEKIEPAETWKDTIEVLSIKGRRDYLKVRVADPERFTGHTYSVTVHKDNKDLFWRISDESSGEIKRDSLAFSYEPGYYSPVVDGLLFENNNPRPGINEKRPYDYEGYRWVSGYNWGAPFFFGAMDNGVNYFGSTISDPAEYKNIRIFWAADTLHLPTTLPKAERVAASREQFPDRWSRGRTYRKDLGYAAAGIGDLPFAVYDMDQDPPQRLNVCFVEDAIDGSANLLWDMGWDGKSFAEKGGNELLFFMASDYDEGQSYDDDPRGLSADVMYVLWPAGRGTLGYLQEPFTLDIYKANPNSVGDSLVIDAPASEDEVTSNVPSDYYLRQNYPNPFNPSTNIYFGLSQDINVKLEVFNILGQKVRTLKDEFMPGGRHKVVWDGRNDFGQKVSSGVYIYNLSIYYPHSQAPFIQSRKMILLK